MTHAWFTVADVCRLTGLSARTIRRAIAGGRIRVARVSARRSVISWDDCQKWLDSKSTTEGDS